MTPVMLATIAASLYFGPYANESKTISSPQIAKCMSLCDNPTSAECKTMCSNWYKSGALESAESTLSEVEEQAEQLAYRERNVVVKFLEYLECKLKALFGSGENCFWDAPPVDVVKIKSDSTESAQQVLLDLADKTEQLVNREQNVFVKFFKYAVCKLRVLFGSNETCPWDASPESGYTPKPPLKTATQAGGRSG
jgi:hypothetical protein